MVLSANQTFQPDKAVSGPKATSFLHHNKSWAHMLKGLNKTSSVTAKAVQDNGNKVGDVSLTDLNNKFSFYAKKPFLKGTIPNSIFIDITEVDNQLQFLKELQIQADYNEHLWSVEDTLRNDNQRRYAEVTVSPSFGESLCTEGIKLPSFEQPFVGYRSLSADEEILKISLSGLPRHYGRKHGGLIELCTDMDTNFAKFGSIIDCGIIAGTTGVFAGHGYVVLELTKSGKSNKNSVLDHVVEWTYPVLCPVTGKQSQHIDKVQVYATWKAMDPYCRYCHAGDHLIQKCPKKSSRVTCYNCNEVGHIARACVRNSLEASHKRRKTENKKRDAGLTEEAAKATSDLVKESSVEANKSVEAPTEVVMESQEKVTNTEIVEVTSDTAATILKANKSLPAHKRSCPHYFLVGHVTTKAKGCLQNPMYLFKLESKQSEGSTENYYQEIDDSVAEDDEIMDGSRDDHPAMNQSQ